MNLSSLWLSPLQSIFICLKAVWLKAVHSGTISRSRPKYYAKFINKYVYEPIENGLILDELNRLNPLDKKGHRKNRLHQFLSDKLGLRVLRDRIAKVTAIMQISPNMRRYKESYERMESNRMWFNFPDD